MHPPGRRREQSELPAIADFGEHADVELQVVRIGLDYDVDQERVVVLLDDHQSGPVVHDIDIGRVR